MITEMRSGRYYVVPSPSVVDHPPRERYGVIVKQRGAPGLLHGIDYDLPTGHAVSNIARMSPMCGLPIRYTNAKQPQQQRHLTVSIKQTYSLAWACCRPTDCTVQDTMPPEIKRRLRVWAFQRKPCIAAQRRPSPPSPPPLDEPASKQSG